MTSFRSLDRLLWTLSVVGSLVLLNIVGFAWFTRLDLTHDQQFTLSQATQETLLALQDPITIRAYFSQQLPSPHSSTSRYVHDVLEEYYTSSKGRVRFEFIDPAERETDEEASSKQNLKKDAFGRPVREPTKIEQELQGLGIPPVQIRVNEADKVEVKRAYMGVVIHYGEKREVIPVVNDTEGFEYDLTTLIRKLTRDKVPKVAILSGYGGYDTLEDLGKLRGMLAESYEVRDLDFEDDPNLPVNLGALLVIGPKDPLPESALQLIDRHVSQGRSIGFFLSPVKVDIRRLQLEPTQHQLDALLQHYGIRMQSELILDTSCPMVNVTRQMGYMQIQQPTPYPFISVPKKLADHPLTRGLRDVQIPFCSPLAIELPENSSVQGELLIHTSEQSWLQPAPYHIAADQTFTLPESEAVKPYPVLATLKGPIKNKYTQPTATSPDADVRLMVMTSSALVTDPFFSPGNATLIHNMVDWLLRDDAMQAIRSRGRASTPLAEVGPQRKTTLKIANILGLPAGLIGFGLLRWRAREQRRRTLAL